MEYGVPVAIYMLTFIFTYIHFVFKLDIPDIVFAREPVDDELSDTPAMGTFVSDVMSDDGNDEPSESVDDIEMFGLSENSSVTWTVVFLLQLQISHGISNKAVTCGTCPFGSLT